MSAHNRVVLRLPLAGRRLLTGLGLVSVSGALAVMAVAPSLTFPPAMGLAILLVLLAALLFVVPRLAQSTISVQGSTVAVRRGVSSARTLEVDQGVQLRVRPATRGSGVDLVLAASPPGTEVCWSQLDPKTATDHADRIRGLLQAHDIQLTTAKSSGPLDDAPQAARPSGQKLLLPRTAMAKVMGLVVLGVLPILGALVVLGGWRWELLFPVALMGSLLSVIPKRAELWLGTDTWRVVAPKLSRSEPLPRAERVEVTWVRPEKRAAARVQLSAGKHETTWGHYSPAEARRQAQALSTFLQGHGIAVRLRDPEVEATRI